jgi:hypothetical protein
LSLSVPRFYNFQVSAVHIFDASMCKHVSMRTSKRSYPIAYMQQKRINLGLSLPQYKALEKLAIKFGLDVTNTIRHCVARVIEQELEPKDRPQK